MRVNYREPPNGSGKLNEQEQALFNLYYVEKLPTNEIAERMKTSIHSIRTRVYFIRCKIGGRKQVQNDYNRTYYKRHRDQIRAKARAVYDRGKGRETLIRAMRRALDLLPDELKPKMREIIDAIR